MQDETHSRIIEIDGKRYSVDRTLDGDAAIYWAHDLKVLGHVSERPTRPLSVIEMHGGRAVVIIARPLE